MIQRLRPSAILKQHQNMLCLMRQHHEYIPINRLQRLLLAVGSGITAIADPYRHDMVAVFGETTGECALRRMHRRMMADPVGRRILEEQPRINTKTIDLDRLRQLPEGTFGRAYVDWLDHNQVTPDSRRPVKFLSSPSLSYVMQRYRESHDMLHTLLGMPTDMLGEVTVKWVEAIQTGLPMCWSAAVFGGLRLKPKQRRRYFDVYLPWAVRCGREAHWLMNVYFEERFEDDLEQLRRQLKIPPLNDRTVR